jgi:hypothetical protein
MGKVIGIQGYQKSLFKATRKNDVECGPTAYEGLDRYGAKASDGRGLYLIVFEHADKGPGQERIITSRRFGKPWRYHVALARDTRKGRKITDPMLFRGPMKYKDYVGNAFKEPVKWKAFRTPEEIETFRKKYVDYKHLQRVQEIVGEQEFLMAA